VKISGLNLFVAFHQISVFGPDDLAQNAMGVQDVEVLAEFFFFDDPRRELVDFRLFLVLLELQVVQKLFLLPILVDEINEFVFQMGFFVGDGLCRAHG
jgi:hypothetical protein